MMAYPEGFAGKTQKPSERMVFDTDIRCTYLLEFLHWRFTAFYIVRNAHIVGYCGGVIAYRLIFFVLSHRMLHQISTKLTPRLTPVLLDKLDFSVQ